MNSIWLSPSVMCIPAWQGAGQAVEEAQQAGAALMHADVMDGEFVPNIMLGTENIKNLRLVSRVPLDLHLMIQRPEDKLGWFGIQPGDYVSVHAESTRHLHRALAMVRDLGAHPSAAINPGTPIGAIEDVLEEVDMVLVMTVDPGFAGQRLVPGTLKKAARLRELLDRAGRQSTRIQVDGNVSFENAPKMRAAGADVFVCGTSGMFCPGGTVRENTEKMLAAISAAEREG